MIKSLQKKVTILLYSADQYGALDSAIQMLSDIGKSLIL